MPGQFYKPSFITCIIIVFTIASCQHKKTPAAQNDTVAPKQNPPDSNSPKPVNNHILVGTTVLRGSDKNMEARWSYGIYLDSLASSDCQSQGETPAPTKITGITLVNDSTLIITANIFANCGQSFLGEIEILHDNTINLLHHGYGDFATCTCCFGLTYKFELFKNDSAPELSKLKFVTINGVDKKRLPKLTP